MSGATQPRLGALTSVRFFAAFYILLFHSAAIQAFGWAPAWLQRFASVGYIGVSMFFVLSGFILVYTYSGREFKLGQFWRARLARLYPVYLLSLALTGPFFFYVVLKMDVPSLWYFKTHLASTTVLVLGMLQAWRPMAALGWNGPAWAVSVEIFFYAVFPFLLRRFIRASNRALAATALVGWVVVMALDLTYVILNPDHAVVSSSTDSLFWLSALKFHPLMRLPEFVIGLACGCWFTRGALSPRWATPLVQGGAAALALLIAFSPHIPYPVMHTGLCAPAFAAILCGLALRPRWASVLESRWLVLLGESSYCFYLLHVTVLGLCLFPTLKLGARPSGIMWLGGALAAIAIGMLVYRFVEEPARRWLRGTPKPAAVAAESTA